MKRLFYVAALASACGDDGVQPSSPCQPTEGTVARILDIDAGGETVTVRYLLVDTPETSSNDCFAEEARRLNEQLVLGAEVTLEYDGGQCTDMFQRNLAYVSVAGHMVNRVMIERGYARLLVVRPASAPPYRHEEEFAALEAEAQASRAGLWGVCQ